MGLQPDKVYQPLELTLRPNREIYRRGLYGKGLPDLLNDLVEIGPLPVQFVDKDQARQIEFSGKIPHLLGAHLDTVNGINHNHRTLGRLHTHLGIREEVILTRCIDQVERGIFPGKGVKCGTKAHLPLDLLRLKIHDGGSVVHPPQPIDRLAVVENGLGQGCLAAAAVAY